MLILNFCRLHQAYLHNFYLNTSNVDIKPFVIVSLCALITDLNTSNVDIKHGLDLSKHNGTVFKYI